MPKDLVASRCLATANPAAARSSASSHEAGRSSPCSRTIGCVSRTCLPIVRTFLTNQRISDNNSIVSWAVLAGLRAIRASLKWRKLQVSGRRSAAGSGRRRGPASAARRRAYAGEKNAKRKDRALPGRKARRAGGADHAPR